MGHERLRLILRDARKGALLRMTAVFVVKN
jgi:hypothetical protein